MAIEDHVRERIVAGLKFALEEARPGTTLSGSWSLEQKSSWEICGSPGACWKHGVDTQRWHQMVTEAMEDGCSPYDITQCYADETKIYFGSGEANEGGELLQLRAHVTHTVTSSRPIYVCVIWVKGHETTMAKCAAGFSALDDPAIFRTLNLETAEKDLPPPHGNSFT